MRRTAELRSFRAAPVGAAHVGSGWLHFSASPELFGVVLWGRPGAEAIEALVRSLEVELAEGVAPHASVVDASRLEAHDAAAFDVLGRYVTENHAALSVAVTRLALVRPRGITGAVIAGFYEVTGTPYPVEIFDDARDALGWLGQDADVARELDAIVRESTGRSGLLARLRALLREHLLDTDLAEAARRLGVSERTLQRRLAEEDTSFVAELLAARLAEAQRRMRESDAPLATIAFETGFSSQQHLSSAFKRAFGCTPSAWRRST